jgi:RluA family pseudouridine synthase
MPEWIIPSEDSGSKLIAFLSQRLPAYSSRALKRFIEGNHCQVNGRIERFASVHLAKGDHVILSLEETKLSSQPLRFESQRILYEDESLFVYDKPAGINSDEKGILKLLHVHCPSLRLIHRLDRETTGVLLFAKQLSIFEKMVQQFREFGVHKCYGAFVEGVPRQSRGVIENYLGKKRVYEGQAIWGEVSASQGLYACTEWECVLSGKHASLFYCYPKTGRTHQIRVHLAEMGYPILGDFHYCKTFNCPYQPARYLLHAREAAFKHPESHKPLHLIAPWPQDFETASRKLFNQSIREKT